MCIIVAEYIQSWEQPVDSQLIGMISGGLVALSAVPYGISAYKKRIKPNITSWSLWSVIGFALLVTYKDSGAEANVWPAVFGFVNPCIISIIALLRRGTMEPLAFWEKLSVVGCIASLGLWLAVHGNKEYAQYALFLAIAADLCAAVPTIIFVWANPDQDRPGPWGMFAVAYAMGMFAISEHTLANYILPVYMASGACTIVLPLVLYRIKKGTPIREWI